VQLHSGINGLAMLIPAMPIPVLQAYLKMQLLSHVQSFMTTDFLRVDYNWRLKQFSLVNPGVQTPPPLTVSDTSVLSRKYLEETCQEQISEMVPFLVGKHFSDAIFSVESQKMSVDILDNVRSALRYGLKNQEHWMDNITREHALEKLDNMMDKIGYPNMHTAGEGNEMLRRDEHLLQLVAQLYVDEPHMASETELLSSDKSAAPSRLRRRLKAAHEVAEAGHELGPLAQMGNFETSKEAQAKMSGMGNQMAGDAPEPPQRPRKRYSQQQMQMGGYPQESWQPAPESAASSGDGSPPPPFQLDDELTQTLPHQTNDPPDLFAHYYGFFGKSMATANFAFRRDMKKIGNVVDRSEWFMSPQTVNAYYSPQWNEMVFPVAILQPPFFFHKFHPAMNFGSIGAIMGHEMTHGFDSEGRKFDKDGNEVDWWQAQALDEFLERAQCVSDLYTNFSEYGMNLFGANEVGENIADFGGVKFAFRAMQQYTKAAREKGVQFPPPPNGLTDEQLYFVAYGQTWCTKSDPDFVLEQMQTDEHSPARERVNGPLMSSPDFHRTFQCQPGSPMNPAAQQCRMW